MKVKATMYLHAEKNAWKCDDSEPDIEFSIKSYQSETCGFVISEFEVETEAPEVSVNDLNEKSIERLREQQEKIKSDAHLKVENIEEQIQSLLALPAP